jgi:glycosyltransferase involved in cell wall biosynthesis
MICLEGSPIEEHLRKQDAGVLIRSLPFRPRDHFDYKLKAEIERWVIEDRVNVLHTHQPSLLGSLIPWVYRREDIVVIASRHIMNNHNKRGLYHRWLYRRLDALVVMSQTLRANVLATHALKERQVKVIHLGLDFDVFKHERVDYQKQRASWGADEHTTVIGLVGRIDPAKGQATFIKAAAGLTKNLKPDERVKFVIVGEETRGLDHSYMEELQELVRAFRLEDFVVFAGFQANIPEVMAALDIVVMPSRQEAFGLVAIEAMAMECPIVISNGGSAQEIVGAEEYGLLMRTEDAFDLQRQMRFLLDHPERWREMGKKARAHVVANFDRKVRLQRTLELYEWCLRRRGR